MREVPGKVLLFNINSNEGYTNGQNPVHTSYHTGPYQVHTKYATCTVSLLIELVLLTAAVIVLRADGAEDADKTLSTVSHSAMIRVRGLC